MKRRLKNKRQVQQWIEQGITLLAAKRQFKNSIKQKLENYFSKKFLREITKNVKLIPKMAPWQKENIGLFVLLLFCSWKFRSLS